MLSVVAVSKDYIAENDRVVKAAQEVTFEVPRGKMFTLLGPSGCGKTTTLRSIAGLEKPDAGEITADGRVVFSAKDNIFVQPNHRDFGMVFQSYAIWPHMTVYQNVAFPLQVAARKYSRKQVDTEVSRALSVVALDGLENRPSTQLSGGQQQRLALARALVTQPPLLLLDEPLSNLDAKLRERMRFELKRLQQELDLTTVYVTHDQNEALALSHQVAVMSQGRIVQIGGPKEVYERPTNKFVADFVGTTNLIAGTVKDRNGADGTYAIEVPFGIVFARAFEKLDPGGEALISVRPEHMQVATADDRADMSRPNVFPAVVRTQVFLGDRQELEIAIGETILQTRVDAAVPIASGDRVRVSLDADKINVCLD